MEKGSEKFAKQIESFATDRLKKSGLGMTYVLQEQGGLKIAEDDALKLSTEMQAKVTNLLGITELSSQLRHSLFEQATEGVIEDKSSFNPESRNILNQNEFVGQLLGQNPKLIDKLAEITAKARVFIDLLSQQPNDTLKDIEIKVQTWEHTIDQIARVLCSSETEEAHYRSLVQNNITKLNNPSQRIIKGSDGKSKSSEIESYSSRLDKLIKKPRAIEFISSYLEPDQGKKLADNVIDEYLETAFTLNAVRVLNRIQCPLGFNAKFRKLTSCLEGRETDSAYMQIIEDNGLAEEFLKLRSETKQINGSSQTDDEKKQKVQELNDNFKEKCRPIIKKSFIEGEDQDEVIDLVGAKEKIASLNAQASEINLSTLSEEEKKQQLANLDRQMQSLLIPIANKVERLFPHQSSTNLADVLEREEAICAGKVNVLLAISKYLGINARANSVKEILDNNTSGHVCYECDLPSGVKLVVDANFSNKYGLEGKTDEELITHIRKNNPGISDSELESSLRYTHLAIANAQFISTDSRVLTYVTEKTGKIAASNEQLQEARNNPNLLIRINPYTGQKEIWKANVPYPHLVTSPDKDGFLHINSSFTNNTAHFITRDYEEVGIYLFKKQIEMSPYNARAYTGLAGLLSEEKGIVFLEKIKESWPNLYWEGMSTEHALMYAYQDNLEMAIQLFEETKVKNTPIYCREVHKLSQYILSKANKETGEEVAKLKTRVKVLMESAKRENPSAFYSDKLNIIEMVKLYDGQTNKKIEVYEEFRTAQESIFWDTSDYTPPFQKLMEFYIEQSRIEPSVRDSAIAFVKEIKTRKDRFYNKKLYSYATDLYLQKENYNLESAISMLEEVRVNFSQAFFQENKNVATLAKLYEEQQSNDEAIALYEESKLTNPDSFWNGKYDQIYGSLVSLYMRLKQTDKAIAIYEEARVMSQQFWEVSYNGGYSQLVKLYAEVGKISEAIALSLEARTKDLNFLNPESHYGGYIQLASLYEQNGQIDEAIITMLQGQESDKNFWKKDYSNPNAFKLIDYYEKIGKTNEAIVTLEGIREKNADYWKTDYYWICKLYDKTGNHEKAKQIRTELIDIYEELRLSDEDLFYRSTEKLAQLYLDEGQTQKAIKALEEGKDNFDYFPIRNIITLAELYLQNNDREKAKSAYEDAIKGYKRFERPELIRRLIDQARTKGIELSDA